MKDTLSISGALLALTAVFQTASANPVGGNVTVGSATITQDGDILSVVTGTTRTVIDWDSFSISANQLTQIMQPNANSATLNRVVGTMPSELLGTLVSNGKVALINENGILVGNTGIIDTHGFVGSTLNTTNEAFLANGDMVFSGASEASIVNKGAILAREGDVFLLGRNVTNSGKIEAQNGNAGLAAGGEIVLRKAGDEHVYVEVKSSSRGDKVVNSGTIKAIQTDLKNNGGNPYQYAMNTGNTGVSQVQVRPGGGVYLGAGSEGSVVHSGNIQAVKGAKGGTVELSGRTVDVKSGSTIDASGAKGGGTVKIGGGYQGKDASLPNSKITRVQEGATIKADATENGKGGQVVVWSDGATSYKGDISAKGAGSGAGGSAEVSGKEFLDFRGNVDLSSASGVKGDLLLDPTNITIQASNPDIAGDGTNNDLATAGDLDDAATDFAGANSIITTGQIANVQLLSNLTLAATNDITVNDPISMLGLFDLNLQAGHDINVNASISGAAIGGINLTAGNDINLNAGISTLGTISLNFGQTEDGALNIGAGGSVSATLGATATGGAGNDTVSFAAAPGAGNDIAIDLGGGTNTVTLTTGNDVVNVTGANALTFGTASITNVTDVAGNGGTDGVVLTAGDDTFTATAANAGNTSGIAFTAISSVDGNGGTDNFVNSTGSAFEGATVSVGGITATDFDTIDTAALNLSAGDDSFSVTGANAGTFGGQAYTGLTSVDGLGGTNDVTLTAGDDTFTATGANAGNTSGIAFTSISEVDGNGGTDSFVNSTGSAFDGATVSVGGITATDFDTIQTAALNLSAGNDTFVVTGANAGSFGGQAYTGVNTVDGLGGTNDVTLTAGDDTFTATGANAGSTSGIAFTSISEVDGNGGTDSFVNSTGSAFDGGSVSVGGITATDFDAIQTSALNLTAGNDSFTVTGANAGTFTGQAYTGLTTVDGLGGVDTLNNSSASAFAAASLSVAGITAANFETVNTAALALTAGDDLFALSAPGTSTFGGINYTGLTSVDGLGGSNTFNNGTAGAFSAQSLSAGGVTVSNFATVVTSLLTLTTGNDDFTVVSATDSTMGGITYQGVTQVDALGGTDTIHLAAGDTFSITGGGAGSATLNPIAFSNIETVAGTAPGSLLNNNTAGAFDAATNSVAGISVSGFDTINSAGLTLTAGADLFTITGAGAGTFGAQNFTGLTSVDALGGADTLVNGTAGVFSAATGSVAGVTGTNFETVNTSLLSLTTGADNFTVNGAGTGTFGGIAYTGVTSVDGLGGSDTLTNGTALAYDGALNSVSGITISNFETVNTALLTLTTGDDLFTVTGAGAGTFGTLNFTGLTGVDGLAGTDTFGNTSGLAFEASTLSVAGVTESNFEIVNTPLLNLTAGNDTFTVTGSGAGSFGGLSYTGLTGVDALGGNDTLINNSGLAFNGGTSSVAGITATSFENVQSAFIALTTGDDLFTVTGAGTGTFLGTNYSGVTNVDGLGGSDTLNNGTALAFDGATNSVSGITISNFETVNTALLTLTTGSDIFTVTGANAGTFGTLNFTGLSGVDALGGSDTLVNGTGLAFEASTLSVAGVTGTGFETVNTALLNLTVGDDTFTLTGAGTGTFSGLNYTGLTNVDAISGNDTFINSAGVVYSAATSSAAGVTTANFDTIQTAQLALTVGNDTFTVTAANTGTFGGQTFTGLSQVDGLGGGDTLVNSTALAYDGATNSVSGVTQSNFETISTALLNLTAGDDAFTVTGANAGTFGALNFTNLTLVDGLGGSDTLVNGTALAFEASTLSVNGVTEANFETVNTALLNLTAGDDLFALTGSGTGTFAGVNYTGLTAVDGLTGTNSVVLTGGNDTFTVTGLRTGTGSSVAFTNLDAVDGAGGADTLINGTALAFDGATNSVSGVSETNFETISTNLLNLTSGNDTFTVTGTNTGTFGALNIINVSGVDGLGGTDTLVNNTVLAFDGATNTVAGVTESNFEIVSTSLLTLTGGNDTFTVTGSGTGAFGALNFINLTQVDALGGNDTIVLTAGNDSLTVTGIGAATTSNIALSNIEAVDGSTGTNAITLTSGDDLYLVTGTRAGAGLGIVFSNIDSVDGAGGTNTIAGTAGADNWTVSGTNSGSLLGTGFTGFSQLRSGGTAVDTFAFTAGGDITGFISGTDSGDSNLAAVAFTNSGISTSLTGFVRSAGLRLGSTAGGSFSLLNTANNVSTLSANLDGSLNFTNGLGYTVGTVDGVTGITTTGDSVALNSSAGAINLASNVTTGSTAAGDVSFARDVVLTSDVAVTGGSALFSGKVDGGFGLTVNSGGATTFSDAVGGSVVLASLTTDAGGTTAINGSGVTTSGSQAYGDSVTLGAPASIFTGSSISFLASLDGASALTVNAVSTLFSGVVGGNTALTSLATDAAGTTQINGGLITTTGNQTYGDAVTLGSATTVLTGANVSFGSTLDGASDTTINALATTFGGNVGGTTALTGLTTDAAGTTTFQGSVVTTTGNQKYNDNVVLTNGTTVFTGAGVNFAAKLDGASAVTVNAADTIFGGAVGSGTKLVSLTTDAAGTTQINGGSVATTGTQLYSDDVTLGANTTLQAGNLDFKSIAATLHELALDTTGTISLGNVLNATKLNLKSVGDITQKTGSQLVIGELSGNTQGRTILFNPDNQIVSIGNFTAGGDLLIFDSGTSGGTAVYGMVVTGDIDGHGSVWLVEGSGGLKVDPTGSVSVDGAGNGLLLVGGLDLALGVPGAGELVLKGDINLTNGARGFLVMNSIGVNGFGGSDLTGARDLIKSLNFSFDPSLPLVFGDALRGQATSGVLDYTQLADVIASKLPNPVLGPLTAAVFQSPKPDTDSASQISDIVALVRGFFNDLETGEESVTNDASAIVEIGKMARFESGVYPPAYGPFALTSYEYEWWRQEKDGKVKDKDLFYNKRYPLYLKQKGTASNGRPNYESILEDR